jgi:hypothetical protein
MTRRRPGSHANVISRVTPRLRNLLHPGTIGLSAPVSLNLPRVSNAAAITKMPMTAKTMAAIPGKRDCDAFCLLVKAKDLRRDQKNSGADVVDYAMHRRFYINLRVDLPGGRGVRLAVGTERHNGAIQPRRGMRKGKPYLGANQYGMHFAKGEIPPGNGFWSLSMLR